MSANALRLVGSSDGAFEVLGERPPLVDPGIYNLVFIDFETVRLAGGRAPKLVLWFRVTTLGPFLGTKLPSYYNVTKLEGKPKRHGGFSVGWHSRFMNDYASVVGTLPKRMNRIAMGCLEGIEVRGVVRTVVTAWARKRGEAGAFRAPALYYSVIDRLMPLTSVAVDPSAAPVPTPTGNPVAEDQKA